MFIPLERLLLLRRLVQGQKQEVGYPSRLRRGDTNQTGDQRIPYGIPRGTWPTAQTFKLTSMRPRGVQRSQGHQHEECSSSKHHNGFAMWDTATTICNCQAQSPSTVTQSSELSQACQKVGIKFGLYFSTSTGRSSRRTRGRTPTRSMKEGYMDYIHEHQGSTRRQVRRDHRTVV